jgi:MFS family permease
VVGLVEGICLVATPALIRDFSPQVGRGSAMGFWTAGPVLGSLVVAVVGSITLRGGADRALEGTAGDAVPGQRAIRLGDRQVTPGRTGNEGWPP